MASTSKIIVPEKLPYAMLPNAKHLNLSYAVECKIKHAPTFWRD